MSVVYKSKRTLFKFEVLFDSEMIQLKCIPNEDGIVDFCSDYSIEPKKIKEIVDEFYDGILLNFEKFNVSLSDEVKKGGFDDEEFAYYS